MSINIESMFQQWERFRRCHPETEADEGSKRIQQQLRQRAPITNLLDYASHRPQPSRVLGRRESSALRALTDHRNYDGPDDAA